MYREIKLGESSFWHQSINFTFKLEIIVRKMSSRTKPCFFPFVSDLIAPHRSKQKCPDTRYVQFLFKQTNGDSIAVFLSISMTHR